ncbi:MAG: Acylphosphatase [ANME-2 cluster archaeon]|nr:Acylphosphatase [ANME-2 cluster archaeon]
MKRIILMVSGKVQQAGYRDRVVGMGKNLALSGYAENLSDGRVKIVAEGDEEVLKQLTAVINIKNTLINVENVESSDREATGEFSGFYKLVKDGETDERLDTAADLLKELIGATNNGFNTLNNTMTSGFNKLAHGQDKILEKQDSMLGKQDSMLGKQDSMLEKQDSMLEKQDSMLEKQDTNINILEKVHCDTSEVKSTLSRIEVDVKDTRCSLLSYIEEKHQKLENEIVEIKATLVKIQASG